MRKKVIILSGVLLMLMSILGGCGKALRKNKEIKTKESQTVILNERQKEILESKGLPTDYEELPADKRAAIKAIEEMMKYLDKKYGAHFSFDGYIPGGFGSDETLEVYDNDREDLGIIRLTRVWENNQWSYEDNLEEKLAQDDYKSAIFQFLDEQIPGKEAKCMIVCDIGEVDTSCTDVIAGANANCTISLTGIDISQLKKLVDAYNEWMTSKELKFSSGTTFCLLKEDDFKHADGDSVYDLIHEGNYIARIRWNINQSGKTTIKEYYE